MAAGAPLIPEGALGIAALVDLLIGLLDLLALGVLLGLLWVYRQTLGALIEYLVAHTTLKAFGIKIPFLFPLAAADNFLQASMSTAALGLEIAAGRMFHALGVIVGWMVNLALFSATTIEHAVSWMKHVHIPRYAKWAIRAAFPLAWLTKLIAQEIAKALPHVGKITHAVAHDATVIVYRPVKAFGRRLTKAEKAIAAALAAIAALGGHVIHPGHTLTLPKTWRGLTKRISRLERRMHRAEGWLAVGAFAAVMAQVLGVSARCLRSGNIGKLARRLCGLDDLLMQALLADIAFMLGTISIVEFAKALQKVEPLVVTSLTVLVDDLGLAAGDVEAIAKRSLAVVESIA